jgi:hypothetical protein
MIENISHTDRELERRINEYVGRSYTFWESLKLGGTGSQRLIISAFHPVFEENLTKNQQARKCNIEIRTLGIAIRFRYRLETFGWFVPFEHIDISIQDNMAHISDNTSGYWLDLLPTSTRSRLDSHFFDRLTS